MRTELLFYGIDSGYIKKEEAGKCKDTIYLDNCPIPMNLPESNESVKIDDKYSENNWELFRVKRRCMIYSPCPFSPCTGFLFRDNLDRLIKEMQVNKRNLNEMLDEAAFFGSIKCFKYLMINGVDPSDKTMERACHSGNEEIIQMLEERGFKFTKNCLDSAISGWENALVQYIIEKKQNGPMEETEVNGALLQASSFNNYSMVLYFIDKGASINAKDKICPVAYH